LLKREENDKEMQVLALWCVVGMMINVVAKRGGTQKGEEGDTHKKVATRSFIGCSSILNHRHRRSLRFIFACMYVKEDDFVR
jgi:hypothetical protein